MQRMIVLLLALAMIGLGGCLGNDDEPAGPPAGTTDPPPADNGTADAPAPVRTVTLQANATNGTDRLGVAFTFNASGLDRASAWQFDAGDGSNVMQGIGIDLPGRANQTYIVGNYTANFTVTYGDGMMKSATILVAVNATAIVLTPAPMVLVFEAVASAPDPTGGLTGAAFENGVHVEFNGTTYATFPVTIPAGSKSMAITTDGGLLPVASDWDLLLYDEALTQVASSAEGGNVEAITLAGAPGGATYWVTPFLFAGGGEDHLTVTVTFTF